VISGGRIFFRGDLPILFHGNDEEPWKEQMPASIEER
jgi:hypothetical protein